MLDTNKHNRRLWYISHYIIYLAPNIYKVTMDYNMSQVTLCIDPYINPTDDIIEVTALPAIHVHEMMAR